MSSSIHTFRCLLEVSSSGYRPMETFACPQLRSSFRMSQEFLSSVSTDSGHLSAKSSCDENEGYQEKARNGKVSDMRMAEMPSLPTPLTDS